MLEIKIDSYKLRNGIVLNWIIIVDHINGKACYNDDPQLNLFKTRKLYQKYKDSKTIIVWEE